MPSACVPCPTNAPPCASSAPACDRRPGTLPVRSPYCAGNGLSPRPRMAPKPNAPIPSAPMSPAPQLDELVSPAPEERLSGSPLSEEPIERLSRLLYAIRPQASRTATPPQRQALMRCQAAAVAQDPPRPEPTHPL